MLKTYPIFVHALESYLDPTKREKNKKYKCVFFLKQNNISHGLIFTGIRNGCFILLIFNTLYFVGLNINKDLLSN